MELRPLVLNRFVITLTTALVVVVAWNIYVSQNNEGKIQGRVVDASGNGIAGANVTLSRETVTSVEVADKTTTDSSGIFTFDEHGEYALILMASSGDAKSERMTIRLWFRNQNLVMEEPIVVNP